MQINQLVINNFEILCAFYLDEGRCDLQKIHAIALQKLRSHSGPLTPAHPVLNLTIFDGVNTRNKVLKILQSNSDLDEVKRYRSNPRFDQILQTYERSLLKI